ncbi:tRNA (uracil-5-)-methyltransferase homolog A [Spea bombifrons]|uniref:tRNA (uracil-5-)-methyltransferase homolog A n=1 Tax=Spea bombifrons TaxID=233779 RepID=UPI0023494903|nr:tRNA (uracil-5-)-methyltransferase homolog A [Spea bombifrons]
MREGLRTQMMDIPVSGSISTSEEQNQTSSHEEERIDQNQTSSHEEERIEQNQTSSHEEERIEQNQTSSHEEERIEQNQTISHEEERIEQNQTISHEEERIEGSVQADEDATASAGIYRYIKEDLFTSEIFKVEIQNLPKYIGFNDVKKFLGKYGLNPHKIKLMQKQTFAFVTFKSEEERDKAMKVIHGVMWKNHALSVRLAKPKADPIMRKRKQEDVEKHQPETKRQTLQEDTVEEPLSKQIADVVTPLWQVPYEEQLCMKGDECENVLQKLIKEIGHSYKTHLTRWFDQKQINVYCPLEGVKPSPAQTEYRNKCEFLVGISANQEDKTVGCRLGKYKGGTCAVVEPYDTIHIPAVTKKVVKAFQEYIRTTPYACYSPESYEGHWKQLTVRSSRKGQVMAIVYFHPQKLSKETLAELKSSLATYFIEGSGKDSGVTSLYFVEEGQRKSPNMEDLPVEHVAGDHYIHEELLGLTFRISPHAFFQVNTLAAEVLYSTIADWAQLDQNSTVLDVCCGTGTIGISLAKKVKKVVGIELCQEAIADAKANAQINNLKNVEFRCGKAEDIFPGLINSLASQNLVAIIDPPRAGLHSKVIIAIRRAEHLKQLIYVSCNPKAAMVNFVDLCRAPSNRVKGRPFRPVRAVAVDLFPQTPHCELLILFERVENTSKPPNTDSTFQSVSVPLNDLDPALQSTSEQACDPDPAL